MELKRTCTLLIAALLWAAPLLVAAETVQLLVKTDKGNISLELYPDKAPKTVENFLGYVRRYYYDGLIFHRVVKGFVIQSGGHTFDMTKKETGEPVVNESANGLKNRRGTIAMARHADPDSATSQFYINLANNRNLDPKGDKPGYTVFGQVTAGMDVVDAIGDVEVTTQGNMANLPVEPVQILSIREIKAP